MPIRDLTNQRFGDLVAMKVDGKDRLGKTLWQCRCDCGKLAVVTMGNLTQGTTKSCGHRKGNGTPRLDLTGDRFGRLVALAPQPRQRWLCICDCGRQSEVRIGHLRSGHTRSCGRCVAIDRSPKLQARLETKDWIKAVKARRICDACGSRKELHAHHIMPFAEFPDLRTYDENGACLCAPCHRGVHALIRSGVNPGDALALFLLRKAGKEQVSNALKYLLRAGSKGPAQEDFAKARHYLDKLTEVLTDA